MYGGAGADWVRGGRDNDTVSGDAGDDPHVNGNLGDDFIYGGDGNDTVYGGQGNDIVGGDNGDDQVNGDLGNDILAGGRGFDILIGGPGADRFVLEPGYSVDGVMDFSSAEGDRIALRAGMTYTLTTLSAVTTTGTVPAGWENYAVVDINNSSDGIIIYGVTLSGLGSNWLVYI